MTDRKRKELALKDEQATRRFYDLVWPLRADVLRMAQILTSSATEADDLAQETLLKAFRFVDRFEDGTDVRAWLLTILRNTRIDRLRSSATAGKHVSLESLAVELAGPSEDTAEGWGKATLAEPETMLNAFGDAQIIQALQELPEEIRWTLLLVDVEQLDQKEAAEVLDVPVGTIKSRLHRGHGMLRESLLPVAHDRRLIKD